MAQEKKSAPREDVLLLLGRGKRGLARIVFGRTAVIILLLAVQVLFLFVAFFRLLGENLLVALASSGVISLVMALVIVNNPHEDNSVKLTWVVLVMTLPIVAIPLYFFVRMDMGHRLVRRRLWDICQESRSLVRQDCGAVGQLPQGSRGLANYLWEQGDFPACRGTEAWYFPLGDDAFQEILDQIEQAKSFIFLEYFIIAEGYMWGRILNVLEQKVQEGVEVRVLYDGTCAVALLPYNYPKRLEALGIRCKMFSPLRPAVSTHYNNRDHRKILVVDGKVAFTGGINLSDEYINRVTIHGHWKDNAILVRGEAVRSFTMMFLQMWNACEWKTEDFTPYLSVAPVPGQGVCIPYGSCPFSSDKLAEMVYMDIISRAQDYVHIMTPYLVIDGKMLSALTYAARRGVEVVLILPHIPDKKSMFSLAKTYYRPLLEAGVNIYEYTPGFVHAKVLVSDNCRGVVGTINFDYRSLYLHFECGLYMEDMPALGQVEDDIQDTLGKSQAVTLADCRRRPFPDRLTGCILRLFAPLL